MRIIQERDQEIRWNPWGTLLFLVAPLVPSRTRIEQRQTADGRPCVKFLLTLAYVEKLFAALVGSCMYMIKQVGSATSWNNRRSRLI